MPSNDERWLDAEAGPVVRPYALTQGRTRHTGESFDLVATVMATQAAITDPGSLAPEHMSVLSWPARRPPWPISPRTSISRSAWSGSSSPTCGSSAWS
jgi:Protein of unknown function (DUF742).